MLSRHPEQARVLQADCSANCEPARLWSENQQARCTARLRPRVLAWAGGPSGGLRLSATGHLLPAANLCWGPVHGLHVQELCKRISRLQRNPKLPLPLLPRTPAGSAGAFGSAWPAHRPRKIVGSAPNSGKDLRLTMGQATVLHLEPAVGCTTAWRMAGPGAHTPY